jgi:hypothetical protein
MTRTASLAALAAAVLVSSTVVASAHSAEDRSIEQRLAIEKGRQTGSITWVEGLRLRSEQKKINQVESTLNSDGRLSAKDKRVLRTLQDEAEAHIVSEESDGRRRRFLPRIGN